MLINGFFPKDISSEMENFDVITALAVFEHIPDEQQHDFVMGCHAKLNPGGRVILTIPSPFVDTILDILLKLHLVDGMSVEEHHGLAVKDIPDLFCGDGGFTLLMRSTFQLGLNNLFVFQKN